MAKEKFQLEFILNNTSLSVLWNSISTPSGLADWFADDVLLEGKKYIFKWKGNEQSAELLIIRAGSYIRFRWLDDMNDRTYFEFKINVDSLTSEVALVITDFAEPDEKEDAVSLWTKQVEDLKRNMGMV
jgi:uncharacterized protein YndB with AHSA1/START domain